MHQSYGGAALQMEINSEVESDRATMLCTQSESVWALWNQRRHHHTGQVLKGINRVLQSRIKNKLMNLHPKYLDNFIKSPGPHPIITPSSY